MIQTWDGVFCRNFSNSSEDYKRCTRTWCGACYEVEDRTLFYVLNLKDEESGWRDTTGDTRCVRARNGDHLLSQFECEFCWFEKCFQRRPDGAQEDVFALQVFRRANLDVFWSRESSTVSYNVSRLRKSVMQLVNMKMNPMYPPLGPAADDDQVGMTVAFQMLVASREAGKYHVDHKQYDTIRRLRGAFSNLWKISAHADRPCPTDSVWFRQFDSGIRRRMGQDVRPQLAISSELLHHILRQVGEKIRLARGKDQHDLFVFGSFCLLSFLNALRGTEGLMVDLKGLREFKDKGADHAEHPHVVAPLLGRVKGEDHDRFHMLLMPEVGFPDTSLDPRSDGFVGRIGPDLGSGFCLGYGRTSHAGESR